MKKRIVSALALILAAVMILGVVLPAILYADDLGDLKNEQSDINKQTEAEKKKLKELQKQTEAMSKELASCDSKIQQAESKLTTLNQQIEENEALLVKTEAELAEAQEEAAQYSETLMKRIQGMYESSNASYIELLLKAESISDFFCKLEYVSQVMEYDNQIMRGLEEISRSIQEHKALIEETKAGLEADRQAVETQKKDLEEARQSKAAKLEELTALTKDSEEALQDLETMSQDIQDRIKKAEEEIRRREEEERRRQEEEANKNNGSGSSVNTGELSFQWPLKGYTYLSSQFGPRIHPITGVYSNHKGCDIPAPGGTNIHSVEKGVVVEASGNNSWNGGYGNYVMISHGNGYVSLYAHCSKVYVKVGQYVEKGDVIAAVGTTGSSTGNHLHLEMRINGTRVDPELYVPKK